MTRLQAVLPLIPFLLLLPGAMPGLAPGLILDAEGVLRGEAWRLYTAHFVHFGWNHLVMNVAALLVALAWARRCGPGTYRFVAWFFTAAAPVLSGLLLIAGAQWYAGLSGLLHGVFILLVFQLPVRFRLFGLAVLIAKLTWQLLAGPGGELPVSQASHWIGAGLGLVAVGIRYTLARERTLSHP